MAMNFWHAQSQAKSKTTIYLTIFTFLTFAAAATAEFLMRVFAGPDYAEDGFPYIGVAFLAIIFLVAGFNYMRYLQAGGSYVAESMGGRLVTRNTRNPKERQLLNIVEEIALATTLPVPPVYLINAQEINAFAAGTSPQNAAIGVTYGCLDILSRDELQGVLAHEFGHIYNGDTKVGMRVAAMVMGFFIAFYLGLRILQISSYRRGSDDRRGGNPLLLAAFAFIIVGALMWFFGSILQAMVSRQREYLADACSVQFTRNPSGIAGALRKIAMSLRSDMPRNGQAYAHLYFNEHPSFWSRLFASHPPIEERIIAIEGGEYSGTEPIPRRPPLPPTL